MTSITARLERLEMQMGGVHGPGKLVVVNVGPSGNGVDKVLAENDIDPANPAHLIVAVRSFTDDRPAQLRYVMDR